MRIPYVSVVLGSLNRKSLLLETIRSVRENGFCGLVEIVVVDGGSTDGTCDSLATQRDVLTFILPNYWVLQPDGKLSRADQAWPNGLSCSHRRYQSTCERLGVPRAKAKSCPRRGSSGQPICTAKIFFEPDDVKLSPGLSYIARIPSSEIDARDNVWVPDLTPS